jgi:hypothetical protein
MGGIRYTRFLAAQNLDKKLTTIRQLNAALLYQFYNEKK